MLSPVVIEKIKKARGQVRVVEGHSPMMCDLQVLDGGSWITVMSNQPRTIVESAIRSASQNIILG